MEVRLLVDGILLNVSWGWKLLFYGSERTGKYRMTSVSEWTNHCMLYISTRCDNLQLFSIVTWNSGCEMPPPCRDCYPILYRYNSSIHSDMNLYAKTRPETANVSLFRLYLNTLFCISNPFHLSHILRNMVS